MTVYRCGADRADKVTEVVLHIKCEEGFGMADPEAIARFLRTTGAYVYIAEQENTVIAYAIAYRLPRLDGGDMLCLYEVGTKKRYRGLGVAKELLNVLIRDARAAGMQKVWVVTNYSNAAACALYRSVGAAAPADDDVVFTRRF